MIPNMLPKLLSFATRSPLVAATRSEIMKVASEGINSIQFRMQCGSPCFAKKKSNICKSDSEQEYLCCSKKAQESTGSTAGSATCQVACGFRKTLVKKISCDTICGHPDKQKCCPSGCRKKDPCCPDCCCGFDCNEKRPVCCVNRPCCPIEDKQKGLCCKEKEVPPLKRCEREGACKDPCCPRVPKCRKKKDCKNEGPYCPCDEDACGGDDEDDDDNKCLDKRPEVFICEDECPRKNRCKSNRKSKCPCMDLNPNWPPVRPLCSGYPAKDPCTPCQRECKKTYPFNDGLC